MGTLEEMAVQKLREEVKLQCEFAIMAYQDIHQALQVLNETEGIVFQAFQHLKEVSQNPDHTNTVFDQAVQSLNQAIQNKSANVYKRRIFYSIQSLLVAVANIGKLFWPPYPREETSRREKLRESLFIDDDLNKYVFGNDIRNMRNSYEHFDARIDGQWFNSSTRHNMVDLSIMPSSAFLGIEEANFFRNFDPTNFSISFYGDKIDLPPLMNTIQELWSNIDEKERLEMSSKYPKFRIQELEQQENIQATTEM